MRTPTTFMGQSYCGLAGSGKIEPFTGKVREVGGKSGRLWTCVDGTSSRVSEEWPRAPGGFAGSYCGSLSYRITVALFVGPSGPKRISFDFF